MHQHYLTTTTTTNTTISFPAIFTDVDISQPALDSIVKYAADRSFNAISVDGDTSTNDTFIVMANGASRVKISSDIHSPSYIAFRDELTDFAAHLAKLIVRDGEGATKFIEIRVEVKRDKERER